MKLPRRHLDKIRTLSPNPRAAMALEATVEGLTLLVADNSTGYFGVRLAKPGQPKP